MVRRSTRNHPANMFEAFMRRIERASANVENNNNGNHENGIPIRQTGAKLLEKFHGILWSAT